MRWPGVVPVAAALFLLLRLPDVRGQGFEGSALDAESGVFRAGAVLSSQGNSKTMQDARRGYEFFVSTVNRQNGGRGLAVEGLDGTLHFRFNFTQLDDWNDRGNHTEMVRRLLEDDDVHFMFGSHPIFAEQESASSNQSSRILYHCCIGPDEVYMAGFRYVFGVPVSNRRYAELVISSMNLNSIEHVAILKQSDNIFTNTTCVGAEDFLKRLQRTVDVGANGVRVADLREYTVDEIQNTPSWFDAYSKTLEEKKIEAVIACALVEEGRALVKAVHRRK